MQAHPDPHGLSALEYFQAMGVQAQSTPKEAKDVSVQVKMEEEENLQVLATQVLTDDVEVEAKGKELALFGSVEALGQAMWSLLTDEDWHSS